MKVLSTLFIVVFSITQVKNENVLLDSGDCQTKCPVRRQTIRSYPSGTALFVGDKCLCDGAQEFIYEYIPPGQTLGNVESPVGLKPKTIEPRSNIRGMGNYGSLVFSANVQILNLLSMKNDDICKGCCCHKHPNPSSGSLINDTTSEEINSPTTVSGLDNASSTKNQTYATRSNVKKYTDKNVSITIGPVLENVNPTVNESTPENIVPDDSDLSYELERTETLTSPSVDIEIQTSTVNPKQKEDSIENTTKVVTATEDSMKQGQKHKCNNSSSEEKPNVDDKVSDVANNNSYLSKNPDLDILIINTNTFSFNN